MKYAYLPPAETKRGVLESTSKRVRMIFSVMASPNRIDILRILNTKGPLTYSELKSLAGFKSKKESGKFAYHLRKLLRQSLVGLNKAERRYAITNLGKLVLNLARQIEEKSIIESGKMYVRTSNQTIEEFNPHKIIQCLVKESNMSMEQATKITEEVENKIYKFPSSYLTSSIIRDCVNNVLLEHGLEEHMNKLIKLGIPVYDLTKKLSNDDGLLKNGISDILVDISKNVFSDHFKNIFPKDILDMHFSGEIHLNDIGYWGLYPDTVFVNVEQLLDKNINLNGCSIFLSKINNLESSNNALSLLISLLKQEASKEIVLEGFERLFNNLNYHALPNYFANSLITSTLSSRLHSSPFITFVLALTEENRELLLKLLNGYLLYLEKIPVPQFAILVISANDIPKELLILMIKIAKIGGKISISKRSIRNSKGIFKIKHVDALPVISFHSLSLNLPRLAYQSNKDETYFRAKLALLLKPSIDAMILKKNLISGHIHNNLLPILSNVIGYPNSGSTNHVLNLTGINESVFDILGYSLSEGFNVIKKAIKSANDIISDLDKFSSDGFGISFVPDSSSSRFALLDSEKFGKISHDFNSYSQGLILQKRDFMDSDSSISSKFIEFDDLITGGFYTGLQISDLSLSDSENLLSNAINVLPYFSLISNQILCNVCNSRVINSKICSICNSNNLMIVG